MNNVVAMKYLKRIMRAKGYVRALVLSNSTDFNIIKQIHNKFYLSFIHTFDFLTESKCVINTMMLVVDQLLLFDADEWSSFSTSMVATVISADDG